MKKVLVIEDNDDIRENTAELLELNHYAVITATSGAAGFESAKQNLPDIILCDMMMPGSDGQAFLKLAKENTVTSSIPLIFFSAGSLAPDIQKRLVKGSDVYLPKPFTEKDLLVAISAGLDMNA